MAVNLVNSNHIEFIKYVEALGLLEGRFKDLKNENAIPGTVKRGCCSLLFSAIDIIEEKKVAIKFFDPDLLSEDYWIEAFNREPEILRTITAKRRCLSLICGLSGLKWVISQPSGINVQIEMKYFVMEWVEKDVDKYFLYHETHNADVKLEFFRLIVLAVFAIHSRDIHHRDIKVDNIRQHGQDNNEDAVLIDFGLAASLESPKLSARYPDGPVGCNWYAAPEAFVGLQSCRKIGHLTDIYSLGSLLFELFNYGFFWEAQVKNQNFKMYLNTLKLALSQEPDEKGKIEKWNELLPKIKLTWSSFSLQPS